MPFGHRPGTVVGHARALDVCPYRLRGCVSRAVSCSFPVRVDLEPTGRIGVAVTLDLRLIVYAVGVQVRGLVRNVMSPSRALPMLGTDRDNGTVSF